jgi:hypothetical protein
MSAESVCESDQVIEPEGMLIVESFGPLPNPRVERGQAHGGAYHRARHRRHRVDVATDGHRLSQHRRGIVRLARYA